jgi:uncharacterized membrane protein
VETAIKESERQHRGELRLAVEGALPLASLLRKTTPRQRAEQAFGELRVWDTEDNSGVLIYVQLADRDIEIVADRGIAAKVAQADWERICRDMEEAFRGRRFEQGTLAAIAEVTQLLALHFPPRARNPNELPDRPAVL